MQSVKGSEHKDAERCAYLMKEILCLFQPKLCAPPNEAVYAEVFVELRLILQFFRRISFILSIV